MTRFNYENIVEKIKTSKYNKLFSSVFYGQREYLFPMKNHKDEEFRDLAVMSMLPFTIAVAHIIMKKFCAHIELTNEYDFDDITQECCLFFVENIHSWKSDLSPCKTFLCHLFIWRFYDKLRSKGIIVRKGLNKIYVINSAKWMFANYQDVLYENWINSHTDFYKSNLNTLKMSEGEKIRQLLDEIKRILSNREWMIFKKWIVENKSKQQVAKEIKSNIYDVAKSMYGLGSSVLGNKENPRSNSIQGKVNTLKEKWMGLFEPENH